MIIKLSFVCKSIKYKNVPMLVKHNKSNSKTPMTDNQARIVTSPGMAQPGPGLGLACERLAAWSLPTGPGWAKPNRATLIQPPVDSPPTEGDIGVMCNVV